MTITTQTRPLGPGGRFMKRSLIIDTHASSCYFRTSVEGDGRKALIQITERCNLHCAHCFVSSGNWGEHMVRRDIADKVLPRLLLAHGYPLGGFLRDLRGTRMRARGGQEELRNPGLTLATA
jgi:hypothetical protein